MILVDEVWTGGLLTLLEAPGLREVLTRVALVGLGAAGLADLPGHVLTHLARGVSADLTKKAQHLSAIYVETQLMVLGDQL